MLTIYMSTDWVAARDRILDLVRQDVKAKKEGTILIVPELISHFTERRLCKVAGDTASRYAEVLSFTRLARRVSDYTHLPPIPCMDNGGRIVAVAAAARKLHGQLKAYASVETRPDFLSGLVDAIDEFKRCRISSADLLEASKRTEGSLAQKLEELSLLLDSYDALCARGKRDPRDVMNWLLDVLADSDFAQHHRVYVDGFPDLTGQHMAILEHFICSGTQITVSVNCDKLNSVDAAFIKASETAMALVNCARKAGVAYEIKTEPTRGKPPYYIAQKLFYGDTKINEQSACLRLYRTQTAHDESVLCAERIMELVASGCRYRDIGVVCTDMTAYKSSISMVFQRCGIPTYLSGTEDILDKSVIGTVLAALDAALNGFEQSDVMRYLKSGLSALDLDNCDLLENYVIRWSISGNRWSDPWTNHPRGLVDDWNEEDYALLSKINELRNNVMTPLIALRDGFKSSHNLKDQIISLYSFMDSTMLAKKLDDLSTLLDAKGDNRGAQIAAQLWEILISALEQLYDVLGDTSWEPDAFTKLFKLLLSQYDVGTIPPVLDAVSVGPISFMRCQQTKHLILLGALEGAFPSYSGTKGILSDQERIALRKLELGLTGGSLDGLRAEFAEIYGVFCGADETLTVSCPAGRPSYLYRRLSEMACKETSVCDLMGAALTSPVEACAYIFRNGSAENAVKLGIFEDYQSLRGKCAYQYGALTREAVQKLYGTKLRLSASQIDKQANCRFSYFLKYGLDLREVKPITVDPAEFGTYVHHVLEYTARQIMASGGFRAISENEAVKIAEKHSDAYIRKHFKDLDSKRVQYLMERNILELRLIVRELWQELHDSDFEPVGFEVGFGKNDSTIGAVSFFGKDMSGELIGFVDRVDRFVHNGNNYFRVVDYKSGSKVFDYCDIYIGYGLQMLLYLFTLEEQGTSLLGESARCAGVQYFIAKAPIAKTQGLISEEDALNRRKKEWKRAGLILNDEDILHACEAYSEQKRIVLRKGSRKTFYGDLTDREQFKLLKKYVFRLVEGMIDQISSGCVDPNPYTRGNNHNACKFCPYGQICHWQNVPGRRNYKELKAEEFWSSIEKEMMKDG